MNSHSRYHIYITKEYERRSCVLIIVYFKESNIAPGIKYKLLHGFFGSEVLIICRPVNGCEIVVVTLARSGMFRALNVYEAMIKQFTHKQII